MTIQEILDRAERLRIYKNASYLPDGSVDCLYDLRKAIRNSGFTYICRYHDKSNSELEAPIEVFNWFYSSTLWDFLVKGLFRNEKTKSKFIVYYCQKAIAQLSYGIEKARIKFGENNYLTEEEYEKLIIHPDREKLLEFLLADEASGDIAKQILSWA